MADTTTTNYGLTKPEVGASEDTWGTKINTNLDTLDTTVDSIQGKSGAATLKHTDSAKLTTTATGIDVTGNVTMATGGSIVAGGVNDLILNAGESGTPDIYLQSGSSTKVKIEGSNGNVGIGNIVASSMNAGANQLVVGSGSAGQGITLYSSTSTAGSIHFADGTSGSEAYRGQLVYNHSGDYMAMYTAASEAMRIDSSGNLMVGTTDTTPGIGDTGAGVSMSAANGLIVSRSGEAPLNLNRNTDDGDLILLRRDGAGTVSGRIGAQGGDLFLGTDDANIKFYNSESIQPVNSVGGVRDNAIDLGSSNARFRSLYLSGNALVGRTSSLSGQSGSVSANTVLSVHGGLSAHATSAGILEHYNDETLLRSYGANAGSGKLVFKVGGGGGSADSEAMRIDSSGNVGISTSDPKSALEVKGTFGAPATSGSAAGFISRFSQTSGVGSLDFGFGDPYSWIQSRRSDDYATNFDLALQPNGGNVGIGTSSPSEKLHVNSGTGNVPALFQSTDSLALITFKDNSTNTDVGVGAQGNDQVFYAGSERMRIDSSGNVGIGTSSPSTKLDVAGSGKFQPAIGGGDALVTIAQTNSNAYVHAGIKINAGNTNPFYIYQSGSSGNLRFNYNSMSDSGGQMILDTSGNLLVGTTSQINVAKHSILGTNATNVLGLKTEHGNYLITGFSSTTNTFVVQASGNVLNQNNSYGALSDERLKSNVVDAASQLDDIMAVQVRSYTLNSTGETHIGVVAQELESSGMSGLVEEDKEGMKSVKYSVLYMKAVKAIQEQQTLIESLTARIAALEE